MNLTDSGIFKLASVGTYLDALSSITDEMSLRDRSTLIFLDKCLHEQWGLGENVLLNWCPERDGVALLVLPHYALATYATPRAGASGEGRRGIASEGFFQSLLSGRRQLEPNQLDKVARLLGIEKTYLPLRYSVADNPAQQHIIEKMIKRYSISYVPNRGAALFDIVGFSLLSPFEQMTQLNSLSYSMNSAQSKLVSKHIDIDFARSNTGDGFYIWNRKVTLDANVNLYHFMQLVLADNAIARSKAEYNTVPRLRSGFHVGGSYEFHQAEGLNPTWNDYIVGDVTVELARIVESALPEQVLVGEFSAEMPFVGDESPAWVTLDTIDFVARASHTIEQLRGIVLSGERVESIRCYLTGQRLDDGEFTIRKIMVKDKHGMSRAVYNAKANIYRHRGKPILLGIEDRVINTLPPANSRSEHVVRAVNG